MGGRARPTPPVRCPAPSRSRRRGSPGTRLGRPAWWGAFPSALGEPKDPSLGSPADRRRPPERTPSARRDALPPPSPSRGGPPLRHRERPPPALSRVHGRPTPHRLRRNRGRGPHRQQRATEELLHHPPSPHLRLARPTGRYGVARPRPCVGQNDPGIGNRLGARLDPALAALRPERRWYSLPARAPQHRTSVLLPMLRLAGCCSVPSLSPRPGRPPGWPAKTTHAATFSKGA